MRALLDSRPVGPWQKWMILLCFLVVVMDGFDVVSMFETSGKPMKLAALSQKEMKETEGAWLWLAAPIAIGLGTAAMTYATSEGNATGRQLAESFGAGFGSTVTSFSPAGRVLGTAGNAIAGVFGGGVGAGAAGSAYDAATSAD